MKHSVRAHLVSIVCLLALLPLGAQADSLIAAKTTAGTFTVEGYVTYIYHCPPCPEGAQCKPCMRTNIVLSSQPKKLTGYYLSDDDLIVYHADGVAFTLGQKYRLRVTTNENGEAQLLEHTALKP